MKQAQDALLELIAASLQQTHTGADADADADADAGVMQVQVQSNAMDIATDAGAEVGSTTPTLSPSRTQALAHTHSLSHTHSHTHASPSGIVGSSSFQMSSEQESGVWESRWLEAARELGNWSALNSVATGLNSLDLKLEVAMNALDWPTVRTLRASGSYRAHNDCSLVRNKLCDIMLSVIDSKHTEADRLCMQSVQVALMKWQGMGVPTRGSLFHKNMLHSFHRIIGMYICMYVCMCVCICMCASVTISLTLFFILYI